MSEPSSQHDFSQVPEHLQSVQDQSQLLPEPSGQVAPGVPRATSYATPAVDQRPAPPKPTPASAKQAEQDPRSRRSYRFNFEYTDLDDEVWRGTFLSQMPSIGEEIQIQKRVAQMQHIGAEATLPEQTRDSIFALCFLDVCLKERPDWARDLGQLPEQELFDALAKEVHAHFATFQRRRERLRRSA